jgi:kynurenine aminotransferase
MSNPPHVSTAPDAGLDNVKTDIPFSSRLRTGRASTVDAWSLFKFVKSTLRSATIYSLISSVLNLPSDCINLAQGYMNFPPPDWIKNGVKDALNDVANNHYSHPRGVPRLRKAISAHYSPGFNRKLDPDSEILVSSGANEGDCTIRL